jgi:hypothetical protein
MALSYHSNGCTFIVLKEVRAKDPKRCNPTPDSQFVAVESTLLELLWIFGCPLAVHSVCSHNQTSGNETHEKCFHNTSSLVAVMFHGLRVRLISPRVITFYGRNTKVTF